MTSIDQDDVSEMRVCSSINEELADIAKISVGANDDACEGALLECVKDGRCDSSFTSKQDNRRPRIPPRSRRVPNLLSGPALIPGPMTPNIGPFHSPFGNWNHAPAMPIFPNFMLTPSVAEEEDEKRAEFMREAMQCAVGIPALLVDTSTYSMQQAEERRAGARAVKKAPKVKRVPSKSPPRFESADFPSLVPEKAVPVSTPSPVKLKNARFPSKNQLKKITLFS